MRRPGSCCRPVRGTDVADHLKAVFAKFGVSSRSALVATLFFDHVAPLHATG